MNKQDVNPADLVRQMQRCLEKRRQENFMTNTNLAWDEGRFAHKQGESRDSNPYSSGKAEFYRWYAGWDEEEQADQMDLTKMAKADDLRKG